MSYEQAVCLAPVIHDWPDEETDEPTITFDPCGEDVWVGWTCAGDLGQPMPEGQWVSGWEVRCAGGHVLLVLDTEDRCPTLDEDLARLVLLRLAAEGLVEVVEKP